MIPSFLNNLFDANAESFEPRALEIFRFQYRYNNVYQSFCNHLEKTPQNVHCLTEIPFLPIRFFKSHKIYIGHIPEALVFMSSGTTQMNVSRHYVRDTDIYLRSAMQCFSMFYGAPEEWVIMALLPSYLERSHSSLVWMVQHLMLKSGRPENAFFLYNHEGLAHALQALGSAGQKTLLIGVTYALLDFATKYPMPLQHTVVLETGGMKGRRKELLREEVHEQLKSAFQLAEVHSEYGMTELLSQAYATAAGIFRTPPWMKILIRDEDDPLQVSTAGKGAINVIDFANIYSCSFIATDDAGELYPNGSFKVLGRLDNSDIRGCSLLAL